MPPPPDDSVRLADHGPRYAETDLGSFPVDAWATWTNLVFLAVIVWWAWRLRGQWRRHRLLAAALPILTVGWIGGTIYHATRSHVLWLLLDWLPIVVLVLMAAVWLWRRLLGSTAIALGALLAPLLLAYSLRAFASDGSDRVTISYALLGSTVVLPAVLSAWYVRGSWAWLSGALVAFAVALCFRTMDLRLGAAGWPHGSHYLWHLAGGAATFLMFGFLHALREADPNDGTPPVEIEST